MGTAMGYVRKSRVMADRPGAVSYEQQVDAVRALAQRHGHDLADDAILVDWGRSGGEGKERTRAAYQRLRAAVASGAVTDIFAFDQSRLTRSTIEWASLAADCRDHGVRVHLVNGGTRDFASADGRLTANLLADIAAAERERAQERARDAAARRRRDGQPLGRPAYGVPYVRRDGHVIGSEDEPSAVVAAFREAGSYQGAARLLNVRGIPPQQARSWRALMVQRVVRREAPQLIPLGVRRGSRAVGRHVLAGLLRCHCGGTLTGQGRKNGVVIYRCSRAQQDPRHGRPYSISESALMPWMRAELAHLRVPVSPEGWEDSIPAERERAEARLERARELYLLGDIDRERYESEKAAALDALGRLRAQEVIVPDAMEWDADPGIVNAALRAILAHVELGADLRPVRAEWRVPEWRAD